MNRTMAQDIRQIASDAFPSLLGEIPDPPKTLYVSGTLPDAHTTLLCVVGSRTATQYAKDVIDHLFVGLQGAPLAIVSGLALGVDGYAHTSALRYNIPTVAVPGSGIDQSVIYPRAHAQLARSIVENGGALLSEMEPLAKATKWSFPQRNRIMAGMSHAILLVEAAPRSGTLITARLATEYNRELFVVPGSIFAKNSAGVHQFLKLGATPVTDASDILTVLGLTTHTMTNTSEGHAKLSEPEERILAVLSEPLSRDELFHRLALPIPAVQVVLSKLELEGRIVERMGTLRRIESQDL